MKCKRNTDGRKMSSAGKEALRLRVVHLIEDGASPEVLAKTLDINLGRLYPSLVMTFQVRLRCRKWNKAFGYLELRIGLARLSASNKNLNPKVLVGVVHKTAR